MSQPRCRWVEEHPELTEYHDELWGRPNHDDRRHFEALAVCILHAGLGWIQMLRKIDQFRAAFDNFEPEKVAAYGEVDLERLMQAPGVVHNRQKLEAIIWDARQFLAVADEFGSFDKYVWQFVHGEPIACACPPEGPCLGEGRPEAEKLSADLRKRGFKFAGPGTAMGFMEDVGMLNHHGAECFLADR